MIRRNTWILLLLLVVLVGFAFYWKNHKAQQAAAATPTTSAAAEHPLFNIADGAPSGLKITDATGNSVEIARNGSGLWVLKAPTPTAADQAAAEAAATQVTSLRVLSTIQLGLDIVGLDKPSYTISVTFAGGKTHVLKVGAVTPIQDGYYTSLDGGPIQIVDKQGLDALVQLLAQPPYATTLTPSPAPTTTPPAATDTPAADLTGTPLGTAAVSTDTPAATLAPSATPTP
jgi:ribosomal protein S11